MVIVLAGLPRPSVQVSIHDRWGRFVGRPDLYYEQHRLGIEYDGGLHRNAMTDDNRRQNRLLKEDVRLLRFTGADVLGQPASIVMQVRAILADGPATAGAHGFRSRVKAASAGAHGY
jgi:very-short-patch-repair endonuclease